MVLYDFFRSPNTPNYRVTLQTQRPLHTVFLVDYYFSRDLYLGGFGWGRPTIPPKYFSIIWEGVEYICQNYFAMHLSSEIISTYLAHTFVQIILEGYNTFKMNYRNKSKQITVFGTYLTNSTQNRKPSSDFLFSPTGHRDFYSHSTHPKNTVCLHVSSSVIWAVPMVRGEYVENGKGATQETIWGVLDYSTTPQIILPSPWFLVFRGFFAEIIWRGLFILLDHPSNNFSSF